MKFERVTFDFHGSYLGGSVANDGFAGHVKVAGLRKVAEERRNTVSQTARYSPNIDHTGQVFHIRIARHHLDSLILGCRVHDGIGHS